MTSARSQTRAAQTSAAPAFGVAEWFRPGDHMRVLDSLDHVEALGASWLRTHLSWADFHAPGGQDWYDWLIPTLAARVEVLPCIHYTPPSLSRTGTSAGPPRRPQDLADFVDLVLTRYGGHFPRIELWNEPNNLLDWDWRADPDWQIFCEMIGAAAWWSEHRGWPVVLGGPCPFDLNWLELMGERGVLGTVSAVGIHGFPGTWDSEAGGWEGWTRHITALRGLLDRHNPRAGIWITEGGYSTWRHDQREQARRFLQALDAPADRLYWYGLRDLPPDVAVQEGRQFDIRHYHMGMLDDRGRDKLLARLLRQGGVAAVRRKIAISEDSPRRADDGDADPAGTTRGTTRRWAASPVLITGGAGFIGSNLADALLTRGEDVILFDNLSRPGVSTNVDWLRARHGNHVALHAADIRDLDALSEAAGDAGSVFHLAAQVAVTESLTAPVEDFTINAAGTLHLLEALRAKPCPTPLVFASTNKVYGHLTHLALEQGPQGHLPVDARLRQGGIDEGHSLDLATPYGCSKGAADQYVLDYARSFGLPAAVLRMSCIYGPRQFGTEDQGWVAHFLIRALKGETVTLFGDGHQMRDILHVHDAVAAYLLLRDQITTHAGRAFNLGGGPTNAVSLMTVLDEIARLTGRPVTTRFEPPRTGDQLWFVADTRRLEAATGWRRQIQWKAGLTSLHDWLVEDGTAITGAAPPAALAERTAGADGGGGKQWSLMA